MNFNYTGTENAPARDCVVRAPNCEHDTVRAVPFSVIKGGTIL